MSTEKHHHLSAGGTRLFNQKTNAKAIAENVHEDLINGDCSFVMPEGMEKSEALRQLDQIRVYLKKDI